MPEQAGAVAADAPFTLEGRISARRGDAGVGRGFTGSNYARHDA
jgi:hypothetical protein